MVFLGKENRLKFISRPDWGGRSFPPLNEPVCGYNGRHKRCSSGKSDQTMTQQGFVLSEQFVLCIRRVHEIRDVIPVLKRSGMGIGMEWERNGKECG